MDTKFENGPEYPKLLDNNDPLGHYRQRFYLKKDSIYMCGNSLGLASKDAEETLQHAIEQWKEHGIKIWNVEGNKYYLYSSYLARLLAPLVGVRENEIAVLECTSAVIHQAISTFYKPTKNKYKILVDDINFPTDRYAVDSQVRLKGYEPKDAVKVVKSFDGKYMKEDDIIEAMTPEVCLILLPTAYYRTAQILDMKKVTKAAKEKGILIGWDLCHSIGVLDTDLGSLDADFAVWCNYKYLNGGPGAAAALYINRKHFQLLPGLAGWYGNKPETQFHLKQEFEHQKDANGWQIGTPCVFSMAAMEGALRMFNEAGMANIRKKSLHITKYMMYLVEEKLAKFGFVIGNLKNDSQRGGHICLEHDEGYRISVALKSRGVIADFRDPNVIRLTPTALYTSYMEVYDVVNILVDIMETESYLKIGLKRDYVV
ncbi:kynureninase-like [Plodia interpunctella]|uniref:kynureninase-like n=1 Tax=Plodia interpunctella TaxID=58824 RepID=UPI0023680543|nr:kynureninase-like [Plodia interpunctella]